MFVDPGDREKGIEKSWISENGTGAQVRSSVCRINLIEGIRQISPVP